MEPSTSATTELESLNRARDWRCRRYLGYAVGVSIEGTIRWWSPCRCTFRLLTDRLIASLQEGFGPPFFLSGFMWLDCLFAWPDQLPALASCSCSLDAIAIQLRLQHHLDAEHLILLPLHQPIQERMICLPLLFCSLSRFGA